MSIEDVRKRSKQLAQTVAQLAKARKPHPRDASQLQLALDALPSPEVYAAFRAEIHEAGKEWIAGVRQNQASSFGTVLKQYLDDTRAKGAVVLESGKGWRIDHLELETKPEAARGRILYNWEEVVGWQDISAPGDFASLVKEAQKRLDSLTISERELPDALWEAYSARREGTARGGRVKLVAFFEELRVVLVRREVKGSAHKRVRFAEFPKWAALYNMDRYLAIVGSLPESKRLIPMTGNQTDVQRGLGCLLGGADPRRQPTNYCYIHSM